MIVWQLLHPQMTHEHLGFIPDWLSERNPAGAVEQINHNYKHGGGWFDFDGFAMHDQGVLTEKNPPQPPEQPDPPLHPLARANLRNETIYFYQYAWVAIVQLDGSFRVARID
jgi:hypothetical protein